MSPENSRRKRCLGKLLKKMRRENDAKVKNFNIDCSRKCLEYVNLKFNELAYQIVNIFKTSPPTAVQTREEQPQINSAVIEESKEKENKTA